MRAFLFLVLSLLFLPHGACALDLPPSVLTIRMPEGMEARSTAVMLTGPDGWTAAQEARANRLLKVHTMIIGIDGPSLVATHGSCAAAAAPLAAVVRDMQQRQSALPRAPMLTARADAADLALHLAQAAPGRFKGLVTEEFGTGDALCGGHVPAGIGTKAPVRWYDITSGQTRATGLEGTRIVDPKDDAEGAFVDSYLRVAGTDSSFDVTTMADVPELADLPLTVHIDPQAPQGDSYAIFLSGDGGWARFDEEVANRLAAQGVPVVGISTLRYLWQEKSPEQIARDIARIDAHYARVLGRDRLLLLGFSLGANTMPFAARALPTDIRARLSGLGLMAPEALTGFEIKPGGWLGRKTGATEVAPEITALGTLQPDLPILCLHGRKETASACPLARGAGLHSIALNGGHHLDQDYERIARELLKLAAQPN